MNTNVEHCAPKTSSTHKSLSTKQKIEFSAVPFEEVIEFIIEVKKEQAKTLQESEKELLSAWRSITEKDAAKS